MNSPYEGKFKVSQTFKGAAHDGLDLVGLDSKEIHATANGKVVFAGWENAANERQGFGKYVVILANGRYYHYAHLSEIKVKYGDQVKMTQVIGIEGHTGYTIPDGPAGSHCHYCVRTSMNPGTFLDINAISGIPNVQDGIFDDGYRPPVEAAAKTINAILEIEGHKYSGLLSEI
jgi:murein DD-endopeptidase MepM/ murein hydrolase activator NlpD